MADIAYQIIDEQNCFMETSDSSGIIGNYSRETIGNYDEWS